MTHLEARRTAQAVERIWRVVRHMRRQGRLTAADAEVTVYVCGAGWAVPAALVEAAGRRGWREE